MGTDLAGVGTTLCCAGEQLFLRQRRFFNQTSYGRAKTWTTAPALMATYCLPSLPS